MGKDDANEGEPWYRDGLRFQCTQCGDCCTGAPGFVWVNGAEVEALAELVGVELERFEELYTRKVGIRTSLKEFPNGDCVFFDNQARRCTVYNARPRQCRTWPFWNSNLRSPDDWAHTCQVCPGSGQGKLYKLEHIEEQRKTFNV